MNSKLENKLSMAKAVKDALQMNNAVVNLIPAFGTAKGELETIISEVDGLVQTQSAQTAGTTEDKRLAEKAAIAAAIKIAGPVKSYALAEKDHALLEMVNYSPSKLQGMRDTDLANILGLLKLKITPLVSALNNYGVTTADMTAFSNAIEAYSILVAAPRINTTIRAQATAQLNETFKRMDIVLKRLDGLAEVKKDSDPEFYLTYKSARVIVDNAGGGGAETDGPGNTPPAATP